MMQWKIEKGKKFLVGYIVRCEYEFSNMRYIEWKCGIEQVRGSQESTVIEIFQSSRRKLSRGRTIMK